MNKILKYKNNLNSFIKRAKLINENLVFNFINSNNIDISNIIRESRETRENFKYINSICLNEPCFKHYGRFHVWKISSIFFIKY